MASVNGYTTAKVDALTDVAVVSATIDNATGLLTLTTKNGTQIPVGSVLSGILDSSTTVKGIVELATDTETIAGTDTVRAVTPFALAALTANDTRKGIVELATDTETLTGTDTVRAITPANLAAVTASDTRKGIVELAIGTEAIAGTDITRAVTPSSLAAVTALDTRRGLVQLATPTEALTGTDTAKAITAAGLKGVADTKQPLDSDLTAIAALTGTNDNVIQRKAGAWTERTMAQLATDLSSAGEFVEARLYSGSAYVDADGAHAFIGAVDPGAVPNGSIWFDTSGT